MSRVPFSHHERGYYRVSPLTFSERFNLNVNARRQIELHQSIDRLLRGLENIEQPLVRPNLKLLPRFLVDMRRPQNRRP